LGDRCKSEQSEWISEQQKLCQSETAQTRTRLPSPASMALTHFPNSSPSSLSPLTVSRRLQLMIGGTLNTRRHSQQLWRGADWRGGRPAEESRPAAQHPAEKRPLRRIRTREQRQQRGWSAWQSVSFARTAVQVLCLRYTRGRSSVRGPTSWAICRVPDGCLSCCKHLRASQMNAVRADLIQRLQVGVEWFQEGGCLGMAVLLILNEGLQEQPTKRYVSSEVPV
jgi:hypothetical protein